MPRLADAREVSIRDGAVTLPGDLVVPGDAMGVVLFAHGSGSSRRSPRNREVAAYLHEAGLATLLFDLLTPAEAQDRGNVFDIGLLARRLEAATAWADVAIQPPLPIGYFGASTGAAAALVAAADLGTHIRAVVSRGGRPDLAGGRLGAVTAPTLLIVGGRDQVVLELNREAAGHLRCEHAIQVVTGATHLFEEPGTMAQVSDLARAWFTEHLTRTGSRAAPAPSRLPRSSGSDP